MATFLHRFLHWMLCIITLMYLICPILSQSSTNDCHLPLIASEKEPFLDYRGCGLFCDSEDAATSWTDSITNKNISILFLVILIPAFVCNLIFTVNNIYQQIENEESWRTTPITYDGLFIIDAAYLVVIICLILPHFSLFDGKNTVSSQYICNSNEQSLSIGNPISGNNGLCTLFGLLIFSGFKTILIYTGMLSVNIWYKLWKPMIDGGIQKKYLHGLAIGMVIICDIIVIGFGAIDSNPSNGVCYLSFINHSGLLLAMDIIPNILFIIISFLCVMDAVKHLKAAMIVIEQASLDSDDLLNLVHRLYGFLIMAVLSSSFIVFIEILWWNDKNLWIESSEEYVVCAQNKLSGQQWNYEIGDQCISELKQDGYSFPNELFFIALPIAALLSNIAIITLTCHKRKANRWKEIVLCITQPCNCLYSSKDPKEMEMLQLVENANNTVRPSTIVSLKSDQNENKPIEKMTIKIQDSSKVTFAEKIETVQAENKSNRNTLTNIDENDRDQTPDLPVFTDDNTFIRHPTVDHTANEQQIEKAETMPTASEEQTENSMRNNRAKSEATKMKNKLENIANASIGYHNSNKQDMDKSEQAVFDAFLDETLENEAKKNKKVNEKSSKSVRWSEVAENSPTSSKTADFDLISRSNTAPLTPKDDGSRNQFNAQREQRAKSHQSGLSGRKRLQSQIMHLNVDKQRKRKMSTAVNKLRSAKEFQNSSLLSPSILLKPMTMESVQMDLLRLDSIDEQRETTFSTKDTFMNELDAVLRTSGPSMKWQSMNKFYFSLTDDGFKSMLHETFTPQSARAYNKNAYVPHVHTPQPYENEEKGTPLHEMVKHDVHQSMKELKLDKSVTAIGSDGRIVLSDMARFAMRRSAPIYYSNKEEDTKCDENKLMHQRNETLHARMLDAVPRTNRRDLNITILSNFSAVVAEKPQHFKAETAKLAFTLKPVHSMKILM